MTDWSHIVQQHGPVVWRSVRRFLHDEADAADAFQQTFVAALELSRKEVVLDWAALLKRLAGARAIDRLRQRRRDAARLTPLADDACPDGATAPPLRAAATRELGDRLRQALCEIDPQQAEVFCLACLDDLSYQQIAQHLSLTANHVGVLLSRARANLRQRLQAFAPSSAEHLKGTVES